ncbi:hypothetical protein B5G09_13490 [Alistipes sp. An54]|uniref:outer membrane beta-barrel protein n=1 Tax=Alistipes sp. An54 TaxID=1965645 RepID=UPI000B39480B|nr:outer membrane beta-barrel protein [Alistipes sp. An54]OUN74084.1 hypothetical protein B5G09_13490 [Alistipes sp. An54]
MKKLFFALVGVAMVASSAIAQNFEKNIYGVRLGLNAAKLTGGDDGHSTTKPGFHIGGVYERLLMPSKPLYLETGLNLTMKGSGGTMSEVRLSALYVQIPVMVNYKFYAGEHWVFYPSAGFYYALGVGGTCDANFLRASDLYTVDSFGKNGILKRSDLGMRFGGTVQWRRFCLSLGYEFGFINVGQDLKLDMSDFDDNDIRYLNKMGVSDAKTGNFFVSIGLSF